VRKNVPRHLKHIAFDVFVNGKKVCRAGVGELGVVTANLSWVRRVNGRKAAAATTEELELEVGGLHNDAAGANISSLWAHLPLKAGDRVSLRIVRAASFDPPSHVSASTPLDVKRAEERYMEHVGKKHGWVKRRARRRSRSGSNRT
jgi:hypothetical protein